MGRVHPPDALLSWRLFMGRAGHDIPLEVKLRPPMPRRQWLERGGLLDVLAASRARLVLVAAPTGFGKTVLAAQWLARQTGDRHGTWVSLDRGDNDPVRLWWHVVCALQQALPDLGDSRGLRPPSSLAPDLDGQVLPALVRQLAALAPPMVLVLDDYHLIRNPRCHEQMAFVLGRLPPSVQVLLITRADPPLPLARLRACLPPAVRVADAQPPGRRRPCHHGGPAPAGQPLARRPWLRQAGRQSRRGGRGYRGGGGPGRTLLVGVRTRGPHRHRPGVAGVPGG
jgi:hypothetical protein